MLLNIKILKLSFQEDFEQLENMNTELHNFIISDDITALNESLRDNLSYMNKNISNLIEEYFRKNSYICRPFYDIWENTGLAVSQKLSRPVQGVWMSTSVLSLSYVPVIILTTLIIRYLARTNRKYDFKEVSFPVTFILKFYEFPLSVKNLLSFIKLSYTYELSLPIVKLSC
uniref:Bm5119, isoform a n=1 Tax=Brugia malayi TaxID=6279 RepID=A0A1I9G1I8_BRUMA|nr:Bm5119, isoform a [Brugia malayi]